MELHIRLLETLDEFRACQVVQKTTWDMPDLLVIPYTQLITMQQNGGSVLGAFDGDRLVGYVCGFLGRQGDGPIYLYSQRMGVLPNYQGQGIGERLKWAQREWALAQQIDRIVWTFDPLEPANARLNIAKLGGIARRFKRDIYGEHDTSLHAGQPTDRLVVDWELVSQRVLDRLGGRDRPPSWEAPLSTEQGLPANRVWWDDREWPHPATLDLLPDSPRLQLHVPADWQALRHADPDLAAEWRAQTRMALESCLAGGYAVMGYAAQAIAGRRCNVYLLEKGV